MVPLSGLVKWSTARVFEFQLCTASHPASKSIHMSVFPDTPQTELLVSFPTCTITTVLRLLSIVLRASVIKEEIAAAFSSTDIPLQATGSFCLAGSHQKSERWKSTIIVMPAASQASAIILAVCTSLLPPPKPLLLPSYGLFQTRTRTQFTPCDARNAMKPFTVVISLPA